MPIDKIEPNATIPMSVKCLFADRSTEKPPGILASFPRTGGTPNHLNRNDQLRCYLLVRKYALPVTSTSIAHTTYTWHERKPGIPFRLTEYN
eukprot:scaffold656_cov271-Chaetoceros_neogracile.AAC.54